jgi:hypothetical protein
MFFVVAGTSLPSCYIAMIRGETHSQTLIRYGPESKMTDPAILLLLRVFIAAETCLHNRCLATKGGIHFTEPLPCNDRRDTHTDTRTDGRDL